MNENETLQNDEEISLIDLFAVLLKRKWLIIIITGISMLAVFLASIISLKLPAEKSFLPNKFTAKAQMLINDDKASSSLGSLSSIASLAGVNVGSGGGASNSALAGYLINSNTIQDSIINNFDFIKAWEIEKSPLANSRKALKEKLHSNYDKDTGVFTVSFEDINPALARDVVNYTVNLLESRFTDLGIDKNLLQKNNLEDNIENTLATIKDLQKQLTKIESSVSDVYSAYGTTSIVMDTTMVKAELDVQQEIYKQLKSQYEMLKVTMASEKPVFQILEYAEVPDMKSGPSRGKLCIIVTFAGFFISVFLAFLLNALSNIKADPVAMSKLKGEN